MSIAAEHALGDPEGRCRPAAPAAAPTSHWPWRLRRAAVSATALAGAWWLLNDGDPASWLVGIPAVAAGATVAAALPASRSFPVSPRGAVRFALLFVRESVRGALDIARRVLARRVEADPGLVTFETALPPGAPRAVLANTVTLLRGTLTVRMDGPQLLVHTLDVRADNAAEIRRLEAAILALFALPGRADARAVR